MGEGNNWGGRRDGAGRKATGQGRRKAHAIAAHEDEWQTIKQFASAVKRGAIIMKKVMKYSRTMKEIIWGETPLPSGAKPLAVVTFLSDADEEIQNAYGILLRFKTTGVYMFGAATVLKFCSKSLAERILDRLE